MFYSLPDANFLFLPIGSPNRNFGRKKIGSLFKISFSFYKTKLMWTYIDRQHIQAIYRLERVILNSFVVAKLPGKRSRVRILATSRQIFIKKIGFYFPISITTFHVILLKRLLKKLKSGYEIDSNRLLAPESIPRHFTFSKIGVRRLC